MSTTTTKLCEPLRFERICLEKVWGGRRLETALGIAPPGASAIGETWELSDRADHNSVVAEGTFRGMTLRGLMRDHRGALLGDARSTPEGRFPLLVKFIDAAEPLSVQVHPPSGTRRGQDEGKTEAWFLLDALPSSKLWIGLRPGVTPQQLAASAPTRDVLAHLLEWPARAGDFAFVPGGTVHAIDGGVALLEVQENSDTTHRLYDWGRKGSDGKPREMHVEAALVSTRFEAAPPMPRPPAFTTVRAGVRRAPLVDSPSFAMELYEIEGTHTFDAASTALIYIVLGGAGVMLGGAGAMLGGAGVKPGGAGAVLGGEGQPAPAGDTRPSVAIARGQTWLVPASVGAHTFVSKDALRVMRVTTKA